MESNSVRKGSGVYQPKPPSGRGGQMVNRNQASSSGGPWAALGLGGKDLVEGYQAPILPESMFDYFLDQLINPEPTPWLDELESKAAPMPPLEAAPGMMSELPPQGMATPMLPAAPMAPGMPPLELPAAQLQAEAQQRRGEAMPMMPESSQALFPMPLENSQALFPAMPPQGFRPNRAAYDMLSGPDMILREPTAGYGRVASRWGRRDR